MTTRPILLPVLVTLIICSFALLGAWLWMTPYRYGGPRGMLRVNRITGQTEVLQVDVLQGGHGPAWRAVPSR